MYTQRVIYPSVDRARVLTGEGTYKVLPAESGPEPAPADVRRCGAGVGLVMACFVRRLFVGAPPFSS